MRTHLAVSAALAVAGVGAVGIGAAGASPVRHADAAPARALATKPSPLDEQFLQQAAMGDAYEITAGSLTRDKADAGSVKTLGARLVKDHKAALRKVKAIARRLDVTVTATPSPVQAWIIAQLRSTSDGKDFDGMFLPLAVADHKEDIAMFQEEAREGSNATVRAYARTQIPVLRAHLAMAQKALRAASSGG